LDNRKEREMETTINTGRGLVLILLCKVIIIA
jgi:hypothetical protein